ncbi:MAG: sugar phosphate isomerase/epimerase family protein, partial [bacterium]
MTEERISIGTDEISQSPVVISKFLAEHKLKNIEVRTIGGKRIPEIDERIWREFRSRTLDEDLRVLAISPGIFKGHYTDRERLENELENILPATIEKAIEADSNNIITFGFMSEQNDVPPKYVIDALIKAASLCADAGIALLLENEPGSFADNGFRTKALLDSVNHSNLFANWDPCNANIFNDSRSLRENLSALSKYVKHVHVKNGKRVKGNEFPAYCALSEGEIDWRDHLLALKEMGYKGYLGIETHFEPIYEGSSTVLKELRGI